MKKIIAGLSLSAAALLASNQLEMGFGIGRHAVSNSPINNYNFLNIRIGKHLKKGHVLRFEFEKSGDILKNSEDITRFLLNVEKDFKTNCLITPYAFLGAGYQKVSGNYDDNTVADLGIGARYRINTKINAFGELRWLRDFGNNDNHYGLIVGFLFKFGKSHNTVQIKPDTVKDSDHDGIADSKDKCPNTPEGVQVDKNGCPLDSDGDGVYNNIDKCPNTPKGVSVNVNGCAVDSDRDGVPDYKDKCPKTPAGVHVDNNGCAVDSDGDGVPDYLDKCPDTEKGFKVDINGCPVKYTLHVNFEYNSAKLTADSYKDIKKFAQFLKNNPKFKAQIQGYTDNIGSKKYNLILSEKRAKAVYEALIKLGVNKKQLSYKGFGEENPIASNATESGRAKNRRVVAKLSY